MARPKNVMNELILRLAFDHENDFGQLSKMALKRL